MRENHLECLLKQYRVLLPEFLNQDFWGGAGVFAFLTSFLGDADAACLVTTLCQRGLQAKYKMSLLGSACANMHLSINEFAELFKI